MTGLLSGATFEEVRRAVVDRARDLDREADLDGAFDEAKWERRRSDPKEHVSNAVDVLKEAMRLGWVERRVLPSTPDSAYLHSNDVYELLADGRTWAELAVQDRRAAYNALTGALMDAHPQVAGFLRAIGARSDSESSSFTIPMLRWDQVRHLSEDLYLEDLLQVVVAAAEAGRLGWHADAETIETGIRSYVTRIRARRAARDKTQSRKEFLKTCEEATTKVAFAASGCPLDYISMELLRRWTRFLGVGNFSYYAPGPYALRLWGTGTVEGSGSEVSIARRIGPDVRREVLSTLLEAWRERRAGPEASMYAPVWELRAAVCWRLRIADTEWDKAISELLHGAHKDQPYRVHLDQASLGPAPASTRPLLLPSPAGSRIFNVMTIIPSKESK
jgi:hypothetical protein